MTLNTIILLSILTIFTSCNGQNASSFSNNTTNKQNSSIAKGDTVSEISKDIWIVFQDKNNHYWFGSDGQGVYRYDGKTILNFSTKHGLLNNRIRAIQEDKLGNVFISTLNGVNKFDGKNFTTLPIVESNEWKLDNNDLWFSILGKNGEFGPYRYDGKYLHRLKFPKHYLADEYYKNFPNKSWSPYEVYSMYKDSKGNIWLGTSNFGVYRYDGAVLSSMYEEHLTLIEGGGSFGIRSIIEDKDGKFWICNTNYRYDVSPSFSTEKDRVLIDYKREKGIENSKSPDGKELIYFMSAVEDNNGDLWMVTYERGVWRYDGKTMTRYSVNDGEKEITLFSIYKDNEGNLWLGTHEAGVYKFDGKTFEKFIPLSK